MRNNKVMRRYRIAAGLTCSCLCLCITGCMSIFQPRGKVILVYESDFSSTPLAFAGFDSKGIIRIDHGQLKLTPTRESPTPVFLLTDLGQLDPRYSKVFSANAGTIVWSFNVSNEDRRWNNGYAVLLGCSKADPYALDAKGYSFSGGGSTGNSCAIWRFDRGCGGGGEYVIRELNGVGTLPEKGSVRITFNTETAEWRLYMAKDTEYYDPICITQLVAAAYDGTYADKELPYIGFIAKTPGNAYFDNFALHLITGNAELCAIRKNRRAEAERRLRSHGVRTKPAADAPESQM